MAGPKQFDRNQQRAPQNTGNLDALERLRQLRQKLAVSERLELQKLQNQKEMNQLSNANALEEELKECYQSKRVKIEHESSAAQDENQSSRQVHSKQHNGHQEISALDEGNDAMNEDMENVQDQEGYACKEE
ncbi:hypothetical protein OXYTRIMIC_154 [Oxytricha trifallax]|uniref:Uncharacterized protein n=1 Tax=Oxytricha trifallax TaxID=1172189 RepID=A0A073I0D9_9SPIT|nr:hypothetical protein OXYTRIMIC_154 [Oxytricha trifallax]